MAILGVEGDPGTIIHGTARSEDLLEAFANELQRLSKLSAIKAASLPGTAFAEWLDKANHWDKMVLDAQVIDPEKFPDEASELVVELMDALNEFAPEHHQFGSHEGDGSDYGFWEVDEPDDGLHIWDFDCPDERPNHEV